MKLFDIQLQNLSKKNVLEKVDKFLETKGPMRHIASINAENLIISQKDKMFRLSLQSADILLNDGAGVVLAAKMKGYSGIQRYTGVDFMQDTLEHIRFRSLRVLFLGGSPDLAKELADCYSEKGTRCSFIGISGIKDINKYQYENEGKLILEKVADYKPHFIFASFGSPFQEKWFYENRDSLKGVICVGVGGAFNFIAGRTPRAPKWMQNTGLEWLFRLVNQPWRWRRQLRLIPFMWQVLTGKA